MHLIADRVPVPFYVMEDPREIPVYGPTEAARFLRMNVSTLRTWFFGREYSTSEGPSQFEPVIRPASEDPKLLSFNNLIEAHVLLALRRIHEVPMSAVREAVDVAAENLEIGRMFLLDSLKTAFGEIFIENYGRVVHLRRTQQIALRAYFHEHIQRVQTDAAFAPRAFYPFLRASTQFQGGNGDKPIVIDPRVGFGQPTISGTGVLTSVVTERVNAGEEEGALAEDYGISAAQVRAAIVFEEAA